MLNELPPPSSTAEVAFGHFLRHMCLMRRVMEPYFAEFGISGPQWLLLKGIYHAERQGEPVRLSDIGKRLLVRAPSVTGLVTRCEKSGLVTRKAGERDQREKYVLLTVKGRRIVQSILKQHPAKVRSLFAGLTTMQQKDLCKLMERFNVHLEGLAREAEGRDGLSEEEV